MDYLIIYASMRPQQFAAENDKLLMVADRIPVASMRPQQFAAENALKDQGLLDLFRMASMRPQQFAAENRMDAVVVNGAKTGFNEAAAICCGEHAKDCDNPIGYFGFNEAAAICCGEHDNPRVAVQKLRELQ